MIGENIQLFRKGKSITQEGLAEIIGVSRQTIAKWESGESAPDLEMAGKLAAVLDIPLDDLVNAPAEELNGLPGMQGRHLFGPVTVGDKGQIVIPAKARKIFEISSGDQLVVLGKEGEGLAMIKANDFLTLADMIKTQEASNGR